MANRKKLPTLEFNTYAELNTYVSSSRVVVYNDIINAIEYAIKNKKEVAKPFAIRYNSTDDVIEMGIVPEQWSATINYIDNYMMENQLYEYIPKIKGIQTKLGNITKPELKRVLL